MTLEELGITDLDLVQDDSTQPTPSFSTNSEHRTTVLTKCALALYGVEGNYFILYNIGQTMN